MGSIKPLPETVRSSVRSGIVLYDLTRVVEELVFNGLDAGATKVYVAVGVGTSFVKVVDNGSGINRDGLVLLGERYATSRYEPSIGLDACQSFGFLGEALCSIADVSLLEVVTKAYGMPHGYRKVMKGRKCLYIGIHDDRREVGTIVVVRDLFYNQPVRRKRMQSSPKKVLHSVKKCVLRIALVHSRVSFRVADIESDDELLNTSSSPSPLQLLSCNFGIDASSSLNELKACEAGLKLSGYISGPFGIMSLKAFQYIYINSRFVGKGPIHKMLNQLAAGCWENRKFNNVSHYERRSRLQSCPTFILNLSCPRSLYDITVEPSKNLVEFRDWGPILNFVQDAVTSIWAESVSDVNCEVGKKRCRTQKWQAPLVDCNPLPAWRRSLSSCQKSSEDASELEKCQTESLYVHDTDNAIASGFASFFRCGPVKNSKSHRHNQLYDNILSVEENFLGNDHAADNFNKQVDYFLGSRWQDESFEEDDTSRNMSMGSALSTDCHSIISNADVNRDFEKPHEFSCFRRGSLLPHEPSFTNEVGSQFAGDDFAIQKKWMDNNEDTGIGEVGVDHLLKDTYSWQDEEKPIWSFSKCTNSHKIRSNLNFSSQDIQSSFIAGECSGEEKYLRPYSLEDVNHCNSNLHSSDTDWIPLASGPLFDTNIPYIDNVMGEDDLKSGSKYGKGTRYTHFPDGEEDCNFTIDMGVDRWDQERCPTSSCADFSLEHELNADSWRETGKFSRQKFKGSAFPNCSKIFADEEDYRHLHLSCEDKLVDSSDTFNHPSLSAQCNRKKRGRIQDRDQETAHPLKKRSRRSHSAPPFHKHRKKNLALNDSLKWATTINNDFSLPETSNLKHPKHCAETSKMDYATQLFHSSCFSSMSSSVDDSFPVAVLEVKRTPDSLEIQKKEPQEQGEVINNCVEDFASREVDDILDFRKKWHSCCLETECGVRSLDTEDRNSILDISSGILHLAGESLVPSSIDKNSLKDARVLQQVDKKFIPVIAGRTLAIIDQHAADERIRLEELRHKVLSGEMKQITYLEAEQELVIPEIGYQLLHNYSDQIQNWGWICNLNTQGSRPFTRSLSALHRQPTVAKLLAVPCILGVNLTDVDLLEFLQQLADTDGSSTIPPSVHRVLNNKACRGAIMFGDTLLPSECSLIVEELKQTSLCFQCAHGRPTTVPLVNLDALHKQINKLGLCSSGRHESWHGLHRHEISPNRAAQRLSAAMD